jgi:hypothetical protein
MGAEEATATVAKIAADSGLSMPKARLTGGEVLCALLAALGTAGVTWIGSGGRFLPSLVTGLCVGGFGSGLAWSLRRTAAPEPRLLTGG